MNQNNTIIQENSISERFSKVWRQLNYNQRRFVIASLEFPTKKETALSIGIEPDTVYRWPDVVDEAIEIAHVETRETAIGMLAESLTKAVMIKVTGLDSDDEKVRHGVATEIIDRMLGRASQQVEHTGKDGGEIVFEVKGVNLENDI